jgi:RNA polymerase sigma-70 factor (ECF subfamily)
MASFTDFYGRYHAAIRAYALTAFGAANADDIAQETMARAFTSWDRLDLDRDPWPWLVVVARNIATDLHRAGRAVPVAAVEAASPLDPPHEAVAVAEERRLVLRALRRLSAPDRDVLVLREWHELSFGELSLLTGRKPNALRQQVFRARRRLAEEFTALGGRALGAGTALAARWSRGRRYVLGDLAAGLPAAGHVAGALLVGGLVLGGAAGQPAAVAAAASPRGAPRPGGVVAGDVRAAEPRVAAPRPAARPGRAATAAPGRTAPRPLRAPRAAASPAPPPRVRASVNNNGTPTTADWDGSQKVATDVGGKTLYVEADHWGQRAGRPGLLAAPGGLPS